MISVRYINQQDWQKVASDPAALLSDLESESVFIVRGYLAAESCDQIRSDCQNFAEANGPTWSPLFNDCSDYYRIHNNYPNAHVKTVQNGWYFHTWNNKFAEIFAMPRIAELFELKQRLGGLADESFLTNKADMGPVARMVVHQYPRGGGGQEQHIDPVSNFARCQTVIQASSPGVDYQSGGFFVRDSSGAVTELDELTKKGDLVVVSPGVRHGVSAIDSYADLSWDSSDGRWIIMPIILLSDHFADTAERPKKVVTHVSR